jgi:2,3-dihydroxy-p-cumate/2,3-dihydroxybenzoate 3,4-dioxygenase
VRYVIEDDRRIGRFSHCREMTLQAQEIWPVVVRRHAEDGVDLLGRGRSRQPGFSHIGLCTTNAKRDETFWTTVLGARVSDRIGDAALLRIDGVHHKVALLPAPKGGVQHINHQVETIDDIMRAWYILREKNVRIRFGPGRHPTSGAMFLYFEGPDGMVFEYSSGVRVLTEEEDKTHQPRQFPFEPISFCMWGSKPEGMEFHS